MNLLDWTFSLTQQIPIALEIVSANAQTTLELSDLQITELNITGVDEVHADCAASACRPDVGQGSSQCQLTGHSCSAGSRRADQDEHGFYQRPDRSHPVSDDGARGVSTGQRTMRLPPIGSKSSWKLRVRWRLFREARGSSSVRSGVPSNSTLLRRFKQFEVGHDGLIERFHVRDRLARTSGQTAARCGQTAPGA